MCPSCAGRRMCNEAAHITDRIFPSVPIRQWVMSVPFDLRALVAPCAGVAWRKFGPEDRGGQASGRVGGSAAMSDAEDGEQATKMRTPHPATAVQPKAPHSAKVVQPRAPHPATTVQPRAPHPATTVQPKAPHSAKVVQPRAPYPAIVAQPKAPHQATVLRTGGPHRAGHGPAEAGAAQPLIYNLTKTELNANNQSTEKSLRHKWNSTPFQSRFRKDKIEAWLRENTICREAIATPEEIKAAILDLKEWLGTPAPKPPKGNKDGFARVSTVRIRKESVTSGPIRKTTYKPRERYDYQQNEQEQNIRVARACSVIALQFLKHTPCAEFLYGLLDDQDRIEGCNAYAHVDWYPVRGYETSGFHKDTHGRTLFVGLIYMNDGELQGPDIIDNPWPLPERDQSNSETQRRRLPDLIKDPIDQILEENERTGRMRMRRSGKVPAGGGIVWFIDELVHHSTPYTKEPPKPENFNLAIGGKQLKTAGPLSAYVDEQWDNDFDAGAPRSFVRIWVTLERRPEGKTKGEERLPTNFHDEVLET